MAEDARQMSLIEEIDRRDEMTYKMRLAEIRDKLEKEYRYVKAFPEKEPAGLVVINQRTRYMKDHRQRLVYFRCVIGYHRTVSGPMMHITSAPNEEWPEIPPWGYDAVNKCQWIYPDGPMWTRIEPEMQPEVDWE